MAEARSVLLRSISRGALMASIKNLRRQQAATAEVDGAEQQAAASTASSSTLSPGDDLVQIDVVVRQGWVEFDASDNGSVDVRLWKSRWLALNSAFLILYKSATNKVRSAPLPPHSARIGLLKRALCKCLHTGLAISATCRQAGGRGRCYGGQRPRQACISSSNKEAHVHVRLRN